MWKGQQVRRNLRKCERHRRLQSKRRAYITTADAGPVDPDHHIVWIFELRDRTILVLYFEGRLKNEGRILDPR